MGANIPALVPIVDTYRCPHCGRDNYGITDLTCPGCGSPVSQRPTSPPPPRPDRKTHSPNMMSVAGRTRPPSPPPCGVMER